MIATSSGEKRNSNGLCVTIDMAMTTIATALSLLATVQCCVATVVYMYI